MKLTRKLRPRSDLKVNTYVIVTRAIEEGINYGWNRAHKHTDRPSEGQIKQEIENAVMNSLSEVLIWSETD